MFVKINADGFIRHYVGLDTENSGSLSDAIFMDLDRRSMEDLSLRDHYSISVSDHGDEIFMDLPGMVAMGRPMETFEIPCGRVVVPSEDVGILFDEWSKSEERISYGLHYHKIKSYGDRCMVLSPDSYAVLMTEMKNRLVVASENSRIFYEKRVSEGLPGSPRTTVRE